VAAVLKPAQSSSYEQRERALALARARLAAAGHIVIVGGGLVGIEMAAEVAEAFPSARITLVHRGEGLLWRGGATPERARAYLRAGLEARGVSVVLDAGDVKVDHALKRCWFSSPAAGPPAGSAAAGAAAAAAAATQAQAQSGSTVTGANANANATLRELAFDVCVECTGTEPTAGDFLRRDFADCVDERGFARVNDWLMLEPAGNASGAWENVFAVGDCARHAPSFSHSAGIAFYADLQAHVCAANIVTLIRGGSRDELHRFPASLTSSPTLAPFVAVASLGELDGSIILESLVLNGFLASWAKTVIEETKKLQIAGNPFGRLVWALGDDITLRLYRAFVAPRKVIPAFSF
jgi:NADH dehydrogenase FAD-containing subunit